MHDCFLTCRQLWKSKIVLDFKNPKSECLSGHSDQFYIFLLPPPLPPPPPPPRLVVNYRLKLPSHKLNWSICQFGDQRCIFRRVLVISKQISWYTFYNRKHYSSSLSNDDVWFESKSDNFRQSRYFLRDFYLCVKKDTLENLGQLKQS